MPGSVAGRDAVEKSADLLDGAGRLACGAGSVWAHQHVLGEFGDAGDRLLDRDLHIGEGIEQRGQRMLDPLDAVRVREGPAMMHDGRLYVAERENNRVLIWDALPTVDGTAADHVFGQPDMTTTSANTGGLSATSLDWPQGIFATDDVLYVPELNNNRVVIRPLH